MLPESSTVAVTFFNATLVLPSFTMVGLCDCCWMGVSQSSATKRLTTGQVKEPRTTFEIGSGTDYALSRVRVHVSRKGLDTLRLSAGSSLVF